MIDICVMAGLILLITVSMTIMKKMVYGVPVIFTGWLVLRFIILSRIPFSNIYESILLIGALYSWIIIFSNDKIRDSFFMKTPILLLLVVAIFVTAKSRPQLPVLPFFSNAWFVVHAVTCAAGYAFILSDFLLLLFSLPGVDDIDKELKYRLKFAFFFIAIGLFSGSVWSNFVWGELWGWYPQEIWLFIVWALSGITSHIKNRKLFHIFIVILFLSMLFNFVGLSFSANGVHFYGT